MLEMSENHIEGLDACLRLIRSANSDNERLASLLMVAKLIKAAEATETDRTLIFEAVGFTFINRLLRTENVPEGCSPFAFKSLALTLLSCFCSVNHLVVDEEMLANVPVFSKILISNCHDKNYPDEITEEGKQIVEDALDCMQCLASKLEGCQALACNEAMTTLSKLAINSNKPAEHEQRCWRLLLQVASMLGPSAWKRNIGELQKLVVWLSVQLKQNEGEEKFTICSQLRQLLLTTSNEQLMELDNMKWTLDVQQTLREILQNRLGVTHRTAALQLSSTMVEMIGVTWALEKNDKKECSKLLLLLTHLSCIEVRVILEGDPSKVEQNCELLSSCFLLMERVIVHLACGPSLQISQTQVQQLHAALSGGINAVLYFLTTVSDQPNAMTSRIVLAGVRVISTWISEETTALKDGVIKLLPFLMKLCKYQFKIAKITSKESLCQDFNDASLSENSLENDKSTEMVTESDSSMPLTHSSEEHCTPISAKNTGLPCVDVVGLLLPGLCHLTAEDSARAVLLENDAHVLLVEYLQNTWHQHKHEPESPKHQAGLTLGCGVLLNMVVLEPKLATEHSSFLQLLSFITKTLTQFVGDENLALHFNMATLALMILQNRVRPSHDKSEKGTCDTRCNSTVVCECIKLFRNTHFAAPSKHDNYRLAVTDGQAAVWDQVSDLWFLGMQALSSCVSCKQSIAQEIFASGWIQHILHTLITVRGNDVDMETAVSYRCLLMSVAAACGEAKDLIMQNGGPDIAKMYQMEELQIALTI